MTRPFLQSTDGTSVIPGGSTVAVGQPAGSSVRTASELAAAESAGRARPSAGPRLQPQPVRGGRERPHPGGTGTGATAAAGHRPAPGAGAGASRLQRRLGSCAGEPPGGGLSPGRTPRR